MKRSICALTLCLALLAGLLTPTALAAGEKPAFSQQPQSTTVTAPDTNPAPNSTNEPAGDLPGVCPLSGPVPVRGVQPCEGKGLRRAAGGEGREDPRQPPPQLCVAV